MTLVDRLKMYMDHVGMPSTVFADEAKVARPTISQILNGRNRKISNELLEKLHDAFPSLNIMWLLFGDGDMEIKANTQTSRPQNGPNLFSQVPQPTISQANVQAQAQNYPAEFSLRSSNIQEFVAENTRNRHSETENPNTTPAHQQQAVVNSATPKRIQTIMVFYTDSSFEIFTPSIQG